MKYFTFLIVLIISFNTYAQKKYSPGYYINQSGQKIEGYIEDNLSYDSPERIFFKSSLESSATEVSISDISEFKIDNNFKFVKYNIAYDQNQVENSNPINRLGKEPDLQNKIVLLKVIVEGNANLYQAVMNGCNFYYFKTNTEKTPQLLIYRKYFYEGRVFENNDFRKLLFERFSTNEKEIKDFYNIKYNKDTLTDFFVKLNKADNSLVTQSVIIEKSANKMQYKILAGISGFNTSLKYGNDGNIESSSPSFSSPLFGVEVAKSLGKNYRRSEVFGRLFYQNTKIDVEQESRRSNIYDRTLQMNADINSLSLNLGYRYAIVKTQKSKLFLESSIGYNYVLSGSSIVINDEKRYIASDPTFVTSTQIEFLGFKPEIYYNVGVGYSLSKYALHLGYSTSRTYFDDGVTLKGGFTGFNLIFSYTIK
ncbi:hypothetical protein [Flavobacterium sp.]|uniref:hypothetical protein n=1 Tax=Flavobacterium sp. TaxID=239 RepID=UPI0025DCB06F|nr:hypothetical protein [Flavobacterium sp.]